MKQILVKTVLLTAGFSSNHLMACPLHDKQAESAETTPDAKSGRGSVEEGEAVKQVADEFAISKEYRDHLLSGEFASLLKLQPANGESGVRLTRIIPGSFFEKIDLRDGDVIEAVNGSPLNADDGKTIAIAPAGKPVSKIALQVKRGEHTVMKTIRVE